MLTETASILNGNKRGNKRRNKHGNKRGDKRNNRAMKSLHAPHALLPEGWASDVRIDIAEDGSIASVCSRRAGDGEPDRAVERLAGPVLPGMADAHSHSFQRAMGGLTERLGSPEDSFWTWREVMYAFTHRIGPAEAHAIAAQLYCELLKNGYTGVAEFHYLHHAPDGKPYARPAEMAFSHVRAAQETGIALTLLPSLYACGNFGGAPLSAAQKRFATTPDSVLAMLHDLREACHGHPDMRFGVAPHSLRAVSPPLLKDLLAGLDVIDRTAPIHMLVAGQVKEVNDCVGWSDRRPVQWLLDNVPLDPRWCLVHCTHVSSVETEQLAASGAATCLCPTTEANLGDGVFPFFRYRDMNGRFSIGSSANVSQSPVEELRWLEYGQRLQLRRRNVAASPARRSVGTNLWLEAASGGAQALGRPAGAIAPGLRADLVVLDGGHLHLEGRSGDLITDTLLFFGNQRLVKDVMVGGRWIIRDGRHPAESAIEAQFRTVQSRLLGGGEG
jgi:formimidoylglutamate deiminase